ncbi:hypothetical protein D1B31_04645 [Neobacillus notoginsengisoli]|uniref:Uncharacterized protein n=1 Tax=Neobacillus notoginsengisoli TaxID=1578198 RepID=A0A417YWI3_9BACI|nr:hypothetical protein [Neobacillus notoginsengisoli]RHW41943.1 hypothetical protein D1B31_04645 [Neobacillus notoginsengisoli]
MEPIHYDSFEVIRFINNFGDEVEVEIINFGAGYKATANICADEPPFTDLTAVGYDLRNKSKAAKKALNNLYRKF